MNPPTATPKQNQIKRMLSQAQGVASVQRLLKHSPAMHRTNLARQVCEHWGFHDVRGEPQLSGCLKALRELAEQGAFELPPPQTRTGRSQPRRLDQPVPPAQGVPPQVEAIQHLQLIPISDTEHMRIWNELMIRDHPDGHGPLVGRRLHYLIRSEHGWLGGLGFAAAALTVRDRDDWIGWDAETRRAHQDKFVSMSRFLIRNDIHCQNLASRVLGLALRRLPPDFEHKYGYRPNTVRPECCVDMASDEIWHKWREAQQEARAAGRAEPIQGRSPAPGREGREVSSLSQRPRFCRLEMCASSSSNSAQPWK